MFGLQTTADIKQPKTRNSTVVSGYQITATAKFVYTKTTEIGWAIYRTNTATGDLDWAKDPVTGNPTDDFIFTGENIHLHNFDE